MTDYREFRRLMRLAEDASDRAAGSPDVPDYAFQQLERAKAYLTSAQEVLVPVAEVCEA
jgi:hypothetical protein